MTIKKVTIVGAGAIGGLFAAWLAKLSHVSTIVIARGETLKSLASNGLQFSQGDESHSLQIAATDDASSLGFQDLVMGDLHAVH